MAYENDQTELNLPVNNREDKRKSVDLLPTYFRTQPNKKFLSSTLDQILQPGKAEKIDAFYGKKTTKSYKYNDFYLNEITEQRQNTQFDPAVVQIDFLNNVNFYKDYSDFINQLKNFDVDVSNESKINSQEYYSWDPSIDWDKFVNFREYYWIPGGPLPIGITGQSRDVISTYSVELEETDNDYTYVFTPNGLTRNPVLNLYRGQTYRFEINTPGHPIAFAINRRFKPGDVLVTATQEGIRENGLYDSRLYGDLYDAGDFLIEPSPGSVSFGDPSNVSTIYSKGIEYFDELNQSISVVYIESGVLEFTVPLDAPDSLFYISKNDINVSGEIRIFDIAENTEINVEEEILGKKTYISSNNVQFTNGLKVFFRGRVIPEKYSNGYWYVEGVGDAIKLVSENALIPNTKYSDIEIVDFDTEEFDEVPFSDKSGFPEEKEYFIINRASRDGNPWSRVNRWFHKQVLEYSYKFNNQNFTLPNNARATRPIIEFIDGLKLFNFGTSAKLDVDLIDTKTTDIFSKIEGSYGYIIDGVSLAHGMRVLFTNDSDNWVKNKIYKVNFITYQGNRQISLIEEPDSEPLLNQTVMIKKGVSNKGLIYSYNGEEWIKSQTKYQINQPPLFELFDETGISYVDANLYPGSTFKGSGIFSYRLGESIIDKELGIPLSYRIIENIGDIEFVFEVPNHEFQYIGINNEILTQDTKSAFYKRYFDRETFKYENGWIKSPQLSFQFVNRQYVVGLNQISFAIDFFDNSSKLTDLKVVVYLNGELQMNSIDYTIDRIDNQAFVRFRKTINQNDVVLIKGHSKSPKNKNGFYETPLNLERNPLNEDLLYFTLGEVNDHALSIVENTMGFNGMLPGNSNLRDLGRVGRNGRKFVKHSGPSNLSLFHITDKNANIIKSIRYAKNEYSKFKRMFLDIAENLGYDGITRIHFDLVMKKLNQEKRNKYLPFYFSDMLGYGASNVLKYTVIDPNNPYYSLSSEFDLTKLSNQAVYVYLNQKQLQHGIDYVFENDFCVINTDKKLNDLIEIVEYQSTNGVCIPPTPTKLGLYPLYQPQIINDDTYQTTYKMIQGHDGSLILAYNDFRDDLILELENRIYNNIKVSYTNSLIDIHNFKGSDFFDTGFSKENIEMPQFIDFNEWLKNAGNPDYGSISFYDRENSFTYNYTSMRSPEGKKLPGFWRAVYKSAFDTDRPHSHPWEMLGFSIKPSWWEEVYGPAPYTRDNLVMWTDISEGKIKQPGMPIQVKSRFVRPNLLNYIPVDHSGNLLSPLESGYAINFSLVKTENRFFYGDQSLAETAWRRSSEYPFSLLCSWILNQPANAFSRGFDVSRISQSNNNIISYNNSAQPIKIKDIVFPDYETSTPINTSGLINYIFDYIKSNILVDPTDYKTQLTSLTTRLAVKIGGFTDKSKIQFILNSRSPASQGNIFIPQENYNIFLNTSSPEQIISYSGVLIEKRQEGFIIRGYDANSPYFDYYQYQEISTDPVINVGGISERFVEWSERKQYLSGTVVRYTSKFYRVLQSHVSGNSFDPEKFTLLPFLPIVGGRRAILRKNFDKTNVQRLLYGTLLTDIQQVVDFIRGYDQYLQDNGFVFGNFDQNQSVVQDWLNSIREFLFWTTQNWSEGSIIALSPAAEQFNFSKNYYIVDDIFDPFYDYNVLSEQGVSLSRNFTSIYRESANQFNLKVKNTVNGIYHVKLPLIQKEHVVLLDNQTVFDDIIYDPAPGYRQDRIRIFGYRTSDWDGSLDTPGFIYNEVKIEEWVPWKDYPIGSIVKYKEFYYTAIVNSKGTNSFVFNNWSRLSEKPESELLTNFDYKVSQFADFYDLDSDNFNSEQQKLAQHLIGYQKRNYLQNIIIDDVSQYKFYQGYIQEKGTKNSLDKLFAAVSNNEKDNLEFFEEWAIKTGEYGAVENFEEVEYLLDEKKFILSPQPVELVNTLPTNSTDLVYRQQPFEVYLKPNNYDHKPFPIKTDRDWFLRTPGYVRDDDITWRLLTRDELLDVSIGSIFQGEYVWIVSASGDWDILQNIKIDASVTAIEVTPNDIQISTNEITPAIVITLDKIVNVKKDDIIGINNLSSVNNRYYKVVSSLLNKITVVSNTPQIVSTEDNQTGFMTVFRSVRYRDVNEANSEIYDYMFDDQKLWIDVVSDTWKVLQKTQGYTTQRTLLSDTLTDEQAYSSISSTSDNKIIVLGSPEVSNNIGLLSIYSRNSNSLDFPKLQLINPPTIIGSSPRFSESVSIDETGEYIAASAPNSDLTFDNQGLVHIYRRGDDKNYSLQKVIYSPTPLINDYFGKQVRLINTNNQIKLFVSSIANQKIYVFENIVNNDGSFDWVLNTTIDFSENFVGEFDVNKNGSTIVAKFSTNTNNFNIRVYREFNSQYTLNDDISIPSNSSKFGYSFAINDIGNILAISDPEYSEKEIDQGQVYVYQVSFINFLLNQRLESPVNQSVEKYGYKLDFDSDRLVISSLNGDNAPPTTFDNNDTFFDQKFLTFTDKNIDSGTVYVYEKIGNSFLYAQQLLYDIPNNRFGENVYLSNNHIYVTVPIKPENKDYYVGGIVEFRKETNKNIWNALRESLPIVDQSKIKSVFLYDTKEQRILTYLDYIDPNQGKIPGPAEQEIHYKSFYDPAFYTEGNISELINDSEAWGKKQVGKVWWNLSTARFFNAYQGNSVYQTNFWNKLIPGTSIEVYEWVESDILPDEWDELSNTDEGRRLGISGRTRYGNAIYSQQIDYDPVSQTFGSKFYFWVRNKFTIPNVTWRNKSVADIASLIEDPNRQGYKYITFQSDNRFTIHNCDELIKNNDVAINIRYYTLENQDQNVHREYQLISEGLASSKPKSDIERKWIDSLVGFDEQNRVVPDPNLSIRQKYGTLFRPRQSWFENRQEALKQVIERVNSVIQNKLITERLDLSIIEDRDPEPLQSEGFYDYQVDTDDDLRFIETSAFQQAEIQVIIENGKAKSTRVIKPGKGYKVSPTYQILGTGQGMELKINIINEEVSSVDILNTGKNYDNNIIVIVRGISVLIKNDIELNGRWAIKEWQRQERTWIRNRFQTYDLTRYWNYVDWYEIGYNEYTTIDYLIKMSDDLLPLNDEIGDIIKIEDINGSGWLLLEKIEDQPNVDYTVNYKTIGKQNGTIQFSSSLYDFTERFGYDTVSYDERIYDAQTIIETRKIIEIIRDHIFVDELELEYNKLFFASLRYVLSEQKSIDWAFKTSLIKANHNVGSLRKKPNFESDNLDDYKQYINEVKPYKTKIREYTSVYDDLLNSSTLTTDFDLPVYWNTQSLRPFNVTVNNGEIEYNTSQITEYPYKSWLDNIGFTISEIIVQDTGIGYVSTPILEVLGKSRRKAVLRPIMDQGKIRKVKIIDPGDGYLSSPEIIIQGSIRDNGRPARLYAVIDNSKIRTFNTHIKFDRISGEYLITDLNQTESFVGTGSNREYILSWPIDLNTRNTTVFINNKKVTRNDYMISNIDDSTKSYERKLGKITFVRAPELNSTIQIIYKKGIEFLSAEDRIQHYYNPTSGMPGKKLNQLMQGVDYGGVSVTGIDFKNYLGWNEDSWMESDSAFFFGNPSEEVFNIDGSTMIFEYSNPLEKNEIYNVYLNGIRIDDPNYGTSEVTNQFAVMPSILGDNQVLLDLSEYNIKIEPNDILTVRKATSDGSIDIDPTEFDVQYSGGDFSYETAKGIAADEIILDGDEFLSKLRSQGPEELLPGHVSDTFDIRVTDRSPTLTTKLFSRNYITDGSTQSFEIDESPESSNSLIVKLNDDIVNNYKIDYDNNQIIFDTMIDPNQRINIIQILLPKDNLLFDGMITGNGNDFIFEIDLLWRPNLSHVLMIDGIPTISRLRKSINGKVEIISDVTPNINTRIYYGIFLDNRKINYSYIRKDSFIGDGSTSIFDLSVAPFYKKPTFYQTLVKVNSKYISAGVNETFQIEGKNSFNLNLRRISGKTLSNESFEIYADGMLLNAYSDWNFIPESNSIRLSGEISRSKNELEVFVIDTNEYTINDKSLIFDIPPINNSIIEVTQFSNHDLIDLDRDEVKVLDRTIFEIGTDANVNNSRLLGGEILLRKSSDDAKYVWVFVNGKQLIPDIDYIMQQNQKVIQLKNGLNVGDKVETVNFFTEARQEKYGFRIFKDMMNRYHYKKYKEDDYKVLTQPLKYTDKVVYLDNTVGLSIPNPQENKPGVIMINSERIEYFEKTDTTLGQLRRGTLGTSISEIHNINSKVYDFGGNMTIPYQDREIYLDFVGNGETTEYPLDFIPTRKDEFEIFVAGIRMRKSDWYKFDPNIALDSPEGDILINADFKIDDSSKVILKNAPAENQKIRLVRKVGQTWEDIGKTLRESDNLIAKFLKN